MKITRDESAALTDSLQRAANLASQANSALTELELEMRALTDSMDLLKDRVANGEQVAPLPTAHGATIVAAGESKKVSAKEAMDVALGRLRRTAVALEKSTTLVQRRRAEIAKLLQV